MGILVEHHSEAGANRYLSVVHRHWLVDGVLKAFDHRVRERLVSHFAKDDELVASDSGGRVGRPDDTEYPA